MSQARFKEILGEMNELLADAIRKYENDEIEEEELREIISEIRLKKSAAKMQVPDIWGLNFMQFYGRLSALDELLKDAWDKTYDFSTEGSLVFKLKWAKWYKEALESGESDFPLPDWAL
jgi:hypothetical protein